MGLCRPGWQQSMEPLWSPVVATGGNRSQIASLDKRPKQAKTVAVRCGQLRFQAHGKGRVDSTSLLLKRGSPSSLRKERRVPQNPKGRRTSTATLTRHLLRRRRVRRFFVPAVLPLVTIRCRRLPGRTGKRRVGRGVSRERRSS
jgi:hypothetical protein